jgi:hypothetical protein
MFTRNRLASGLLSLLFILGGASAQEPTTNLDQASSLNAYLTTTPGKLNPLKQ